MQIGVSPIGGEPFDWQATLISQYANSPTLVQLIENFAGYIDPKVNIDAFYDQAWNIATAQGWGLDVWGRIVNISRTVAVTPRYFGFEEMGDAYIDPYNTSPFYSGVAVTNNFLLVDDAFRLLILAKALANISDGSIPGLNQILAFLFPGRGQAYVLDGLDMTLTYKFDFALTPVETAIVINSGVLPRPTGVAVLYDLV